MAIAPTPAPAVVQLKNEKALSAKTMTQPKPLVHSYSSLDYFNGCSHKYNQVKLLKTFKDKPFKASEDGVALHLAIERAISMGAMMPDGLIKHVPTVEMLKALPGSKLCEQKMALTRQATPCDFWDKEAWIRGAADFVNLQGEHAIIADFKDGKVSPKPDQLHLMATMVFARWPQVKTIKGVLMFMNHDVIHTESYGAQHFAQMWGYWSQKMTKTERTIEQGAFTKSPSGLCAGYCPVADCEHYEPQPRNKK